MKNLLVAMGQRLDALDVDERRDQGEGEGEARHVQPEDRLPEEVARLLASSTVKAGDAGRQRDARRARSSTTAASPSSASPSIATSGA